MTKQLLKTAAIILAVFIGFFFVNKCTNDKYGQGKVLVSTDTTQYILKIDSLEKIISLRASFVDPSEVDSKPLDPEVITKYIEVSDSCKRPHLTAAGASLLRIRNYSGMQDKDSFKISYKASVLGELRSIDLSVDGSYIQRDIHTVRTVTNEYIKQTNQIYAFASYNRTLTVGAMFQNERFHYGINYDLGNQSLGGQVGYTIFNF